MRGGREEGTLICCVNLNVVLSAYMYIHLGAVLVAQWMRPCHCPEESTINKQLDSIAEMVAEELLREAEREEEGERVEIGVKRSRLSTVTERGMSVDTILTALNAIFYDRLGFKGATHDSYYELDNSYIDRVRRCSTQWLSAGAVHEPWTELPCHPCLISCAGVGEESRFAHHSHCCLRGCG